MPDQTSPMIGVVIVSFNSRDVIEGCLDSLASTTNAALRVVVVDNASPDQSVEAISDWAGNTKTGAKAISTDEPLGAEWLTVIKSDVNTGYAGAVNLGLEALAKDQRVQYFWVLNPDCVVTSDTAATLVQTAQASEPFALMGSRILYLEGDGIIQSDGGYVSLWTGVCRNKNQGQKHSETSPANANDIQFISGANLVASRRFLESAGTMREDYFLYYEEVDWAMRRGELPLAWCDKAIVYHHGGTTIGTGAHNRSASDFANYFNFRNRLRFIRNFNRAGVLTAYIYTSLKILKILLKDSFAQAMGGWRGLNEMAPPPPVRAKLDAAAQKIAFAPRKKD